MWSIPNGMRRTLRCLLVGIVTLAAAYLARTNESRFGTDVRELTFDTFQRWAPRPYTPAGVRIIDIDEASLAELGQWPWPRTRLATLVDRLRDLGAAAIAFDIILAEPDRTSPKRILDGLETLDSPARLRLQETLGALPDHDTVLAKAITRAPVVLGFSTRGEPNSDRPAIKGSLAFAGTNPTTILPAFHGAVINLAAIEQAGSGHGSLDLSRKQTSGVMRRVPVLLSDGSRIYSSLALEAMRVAQGASTLIVRSTGAQGESQSQQPALVAARVGELTVPLTGDGELWVYYDRDRAERYVSAASIFDPQQDDRTRPLVDGHVVFVGASAAGLLDLRATALGEVVPGVSIHAQVAEQIVTQTFLSRPDWADGVEISVTALSSGLVAVLLAMVGARYAAIVIAAIEGLIIGGAWLAFSRYQLLIDPTFAAASALCVYLATLAVLYLTSDRDRRFIRRAFGQYLSPEVLARLEKQPDLLKLGGEIRRTTIMFMDVRDFTALSERLSAEHVTALLNSLLSPLSDIIQDEQGTIDKYIGDSIMAFWNAPVDVPDHATRACQAALRMLAEVERLNREGAFQFPGEAASFNIEIGIGLNTGEACVGNMGSERRFNYSIIGDAVNTAARIESSCKPVGYPILISEETSRSVPELATLEVGSIALKGRAQSATLFALIGNEARAQSHGFRQLAADHQRMIDAIARGDYAEAMSALRACRLLGGPELAQLYDQYLERIRAGHTDSSLALPEDQDLVPASASNR